MEAGHDPYAALRYPDYRRLLSGSVLASIGAELQRAAVGFELYLRTGDAAALGFVGLIQFLPVLFLSLPAGHTADRYSRKTILLLAMGGMTIASLGLAALSIFQGPILLTYLCLLVTGITRAYSAPVRWALVSQVVSEKDLASAVTWNSSGWQLASMVGPALSGVFLALPLKAAGAYIGTALCALGCAILVAPIRPRPQEQRKEPISLKSLLAGIRFVSSSKLILATITLDLFAVLLGGAVALLPIFAEDILKVGPIGYGLLQAAPAIGALTMALILAHRPPLRRAGPALLWAVIGFGAATVVFGLSRDPVLSFLMLLLTGAFDNISVVVRGTLVQVLTPDAMRGRVSAVNAIFISSSNELGGFESGMTAKLFGPVASVVGGGLGTIAVVLGVMALWPEVMRLGRLHAVKREATPEEASVDGLAAARVEQLQE